MDEQREFPGVRVLLIVVLLCLTAAMSFELWRESRRAHFDSVWRARRYQFEAYRRHRQQQLAHQLAAGEPAAEDLVESAYDAEM